MTLRLVLIFLLTVVTGCVNQTVKVPPSLPSPNHRPRYLSLRCWMSASPYWIRASPT